MIFIAILIVGISTAIVQGPVKEHPQAVEQVEFKDEFYRDTLNAAFQNEVPGDNTGPSQATK